MCYARRTRLPAAGIAALFALLARPISGVAWSQTPDTESALAQISAAFAAQRAKFESVRFDYTLERPMSGSPGVSRSAGRRFPERHIEGAASLLRQVYQLDREGRFYYEQRDFVMTDGGTNATPRGLPYFLAFDGEIYRSYTSDGVEGAGSIFLPEHPYDVSKPMIKPTFFMDHLFNDSVKKMLESPASVTLKSNAEGLWELSYQDPATPGVPLIMICDPAQEFAVVRMEGPWNPSTTFTKEVTYGKTEDGFLFPEQAVFHLSKGDTVVLTVEKFALNSGSPSDYQLVIPTGIRIADYSKGATLIYYQGQPDRERNLPGDLSIYSAAKDLNRLLMDDLFDSVVDTAKETDSMASTQDPNPATKPAKPTPLARPPVVLATTIVAAGLGIALIIARRRRRR